MTCPFRFFTIAAAVLLLAANSFAIEKKKKTADHFGLKVGILHGGTVELETTEWETSAGLTFGVTFDFRVIKRFYFGLAIDMHQLKVSEGAFSEDARALAGTLVARQEIPLNNRGLILRPSFGVGGAALGQLLALDNSTYLTFTPGVDLLVPISPKSNLLFEIALLSADGGDSDTDAKTGGLLLTRVGLLF